MRNRRKKEKQVKGEKQNRNYFKSTNLKSSKLGAANNHNLSFTEKEDKNKSNHSKREKLLTFCWNKESLILQVG